jgi:hypothetical protein
MGAPEHFVALAWVRVFLQPVWGGFHACVLVSGPLPILCKREVQMHLSCSGTLQQLIIIMD